MHCNNRKIMILGAGEGQVPLIKFAKNAGWYTIVISPMGNYPGFAIADEYQYADISDKETIFQMAKSLQIAAIASDQTDISIPSVLFVAEQLGLPHIECTDVNNFRYKSRMRDICRRAGLPTIASYVTGNYVEAKSFIGSLSNPIAIIKPIDSQGSRGVEKVKSIESFETAFAHAMDYSKQKQIIIEQFIDGQEIEVDSVVCDGVIKTVLIGDVFNFLSANTFSAYERIYPTNLSEQMQQYIREINTRTLSALGIRTGWTHGEYIVSREGEVYLIEVGIRGGGNYIGSDIVHTMLGYGTHEMAFLAATGDLTFYDKVFLQPQYCAYKCFCLHAGEIIELHIDKDFLAQNYVLCHNLDSLYVGKIIGGHMDKTNRFTIVIKAPTRELLRRHLDAVSTHISVKVQTEHGIKTEFWK